VKWGGVMLKTAMMLMTVLLLFAAHSSYAQWENGVILNVQEVDIARMKAANMPGAEAVLKVIEQYADTRYRYAFVSKNYLIPPEQQKNLKLEKNRFLITVAGYPERNNLLYAQVFFDTGFFFVVLAREEHDMKRTGDIQITRMNYEKGNAVRRNNVRDTIQRNNIIPLGIN
jgi:hypothetical protein